MDFLDSLDLNVPENKRTQRVRSWYLYEQFKSLERNQLDATRRLKSRSAQDRILRQELSERKARRKLYNQFGTSQSESGFERSVESESMKKSLNASSNDFFESFHELQEHEGIDAFREDNNSQIEKFYDEEFRSADEDDDQSITETVNSVVNNKSEETLAEDLDKYNEIEKETKFEDLELCFDVVEEKLQCLKRLSQMGDMRQFSDGKDIPYSMEDDQLKEKNKEDSNENSLDNNVNFMWSKLVSFAYQLMQLNHGNCYYDYGSQLLTAVLACDVLRRGIGRMCHILQPYVSPIKYAADSDTSFIENHKTETRTNSQKSEQSKRNLEKKYYPSHRLINQRRKSRRYRSENSWQQSAPFTSGRNKMNGKKYSWASEPARRISMLTSDKTKYSTSNSSHRTIWPSFSNDNTAKNCLCIMTCSCCCHKVVNPMLRLSHYLDRIMRDIDDPLFM